MEKMKLPSIALGTWSWGVGFAGGNQVFGNNLGVNELKPVFDAAMAGGLNLWDSAVVYGMGASESLLAAFTKEHNREDVLISTKFTPQIAGDSVNPVEDMLGSSLERSARTISTSTGFTIRRMWRGGLRSLPTS